MKPDTNRHIYKRFNTSQVMKCERYIRLLEQSCEEAKITEKTDKLKDEMITYIRDGKGNRDDLIDRSKTLFNKTTQLMIATWISVI